LSVSSIDDFANLLFEEAKVYFQKGKQETSTEGKSAFFHASLLLGFCALEAHVNSIAEEFLTRQDLTLLDRSILSERDIELKNGRYELTNKLKMFRLEDRLEFLSQRFSKKAIDKTAAYWTNLRSAMQLRNNLTHPKVPPDVNERAVEQALKAILEILNVLYRNIYRRGYPRFRRGLEPAFNF
jgi:hypothetical protein